MANKGRIYLNVDLRTQELKDQLNALVEKDAKQFGESSPSLLIRKLIRRAYGIETLNAIKSEGLENQCDIKADFATDSPMAKQA